MPSQSIEFGTARVFVQNQQLFIIMLSSSRVYIEKQVDRYIVFQQNMKIYCDKIKFSKTGVVKCRNLISEKCLLSIFKFNHSVKGRGGLCQTIIR